MESVLQLIFGYVYAAGVATLAQVLVLFGPLLILAFALNAVGKFIGDTCIRLFKPTLFLILLGWLGTMIHELGHLLFALLFLRRIQKIKLFSTDPWDPKPGYIEIDRGKNIFQHLGNFFIGLGPLILGALVIYIVAWGLLGGGALSGTGVNQPRLTGDAFTLRALLLMLQRIISSAFAVLGTVLTSNKVSLEAVFLFLYVTLSIGSAMTLSPPDIAAVRNGFFALLSAVFIFNLLTFWFGNYGDLFIAWIMPVYDGFYGLMMFGLIVNAVWAIALVPISLLQDKDIV